MATEGIKVNSHFDSFEGFLLNYDLAMNFTSVNLKSRSGVKFTRPLIDF